MPSQINLENQFGEVSANYVVGSSQGLANNLPAKTGVTAIAALGTVTVVDNTKASIDTALATIVAKVNAILAALKVVS